MYHLQVAQKWNYQFTSQSADILLQGGKTSNQP